MKKKEKKKDIQRSWCFSWTKFWKFISEIVPVLELWVKFGISIQYFRWLSTMTPFSIRLLLCHFWRLSPTFCNAIAIAIIWLVIVLLIYFWLGWLKEEVGDDLSHGNGNGKTKAKRQERERKRENVAKIQHYKYVEKGMFTKCYYVLWLPFVQRKWAAWKKDQKISFIINWENLFLLNFVEE